MCVAATCPIASRVRVDPACDHARRRKRETPLEAAGAEGIEPAGRESPPWERMAKVETRRLLATALDALSEPQRRTLLLRYYGNLEFSEIAELLGSPLSTALSHNRRGLSALRQLLAEKIE
ncbi:MAG TPA: RNA polymerase sigma factor [Pirellulales bacterium]|nr:RNA polymerase sigma factor [Pirellulales bacterium]